jgi:myo-inositol 2-dehydrogenase/D-chiro-inositol 1-dehydrogenase
VNSIKIGLIGCGKQASKHITSLKAIPGTELVLCDNNSELARTLSEKERVEWVDNPDQIFGDMTIKAVVICTPTQTHVQLIKRSIEAEKDVFCEKPLSESAEEAKKLGGISARSSRMVMIGYIYRFVPIFEEGFHIFRGRRIDGENLTMGRPLSAFFRLGGRGGHQLWKHRKTNGGGAINEMLVHMIDLANWYFGPIREVEVISCDLRCPERTIQGETVRVDAEDYILVRCFGPDGIEIICQADLITPAFSQYAEIQAENGTFMGSIQSDLPSYIFLKESRGGYDAGKTELRFGQRNLFDIQMMAFIQWVLQKELQDRNTIEDSLQLLEVIEKIREQVG